MNTKTLCKMVIDFLMIVLMLAAMACRLTGTTIHELLGVALFILFVIHNILNWGWYKTLLNGRYTPLRIFHATVNLLLLVTMLALLISGVMLSHTMFAFMERNDGLFARKMHMLSVYWGFILMSIHLGMHWGIIMEAIRKMMKSTSANRNLILLLQILAALIALYGVYASFTREIGAKLLLYFTFDFWNYDQSPIIFFLDYLSIMGLYVCVTYSAMKFVQRNSSKI